MESKHCTGCAACADVCPVKAVFMEEDGEGFVYPKVEENLCISCGKCRAVGPAAPLSAEPDRTGCVEVYAAWSLDPEIRYDSTSGGIFTEFALAVLAGGGAVCGAAYDGKHMVRHLIADTEQGIGKLRQSKYVQSDMKGIYQEAGSVLRQGNMLLFCGTPCQCEGLFRYCREEKIDTGNLYLADFICRGSNSPKVYRKFLKELEEEYRSLVKRVWFKNKTYGWNRFSTRIEFENGEAYLRDRYHDPYIRGYIEENLYIRPSCSECRFKGFQRRADVTLADFWGVQIQGYMEESDGGTSMVMLHTEKGRRLWDLISHRLYWNEKEPEEAAAGNECFYHCAPPGRHREQFMEDLDRMPVIENIERFLRKSQK